MEWIKNFFKNLKLASAPVVPNFKPGIIDRMMHKPLVAPKFYAGSIDWKGIVIHHSDVEDGPGDDWSAIRRFHTSYRIDGRIVTADEFNKRMHTGEGAEFLKPWRDIAYHFGIEYEVDRLMLRLGRPLNWVGAHAGVPGNNKFNEDYIGICVVGDFDLKSPFPDEMEMLVRLIKELMAHYNIKPTNVIGHREVYPMMNRPVEKTCPGKLFDMDALRKMLA